jgi:alpha-mannosidase
VFNPSSYSRDEIVDVGGGELCRVAVPACGWTTVHRGEPGAGGTVRVDDGVLENDRLRVTWDGDGLITSIWDKDSEREVVADGARANLFQLHRDHPVAYDAWDIDLTYLDARVDLVDVESIEVVERDPQRAGVRTVRRFGASTITQTMRLAAGSRRLEFDTTVDWLEDHRLLKVAFPVAVRSARATYEIQHGWIERPTVRNTTWDLARFEVSAHRWADLSETGYGVALLNDCKYGYDILGNVMRLTLLRAPGWPDPEADRGQHRFTYALLPHAGGILDGGVVREAEHLNLPVDVVPGRAPTASFVTVDRDGVSVEAVKRADAGDGLVVRVCEVVGSRGPARITVAAPITDAVVTDLLERPIADAAVDGSTITVPLRPFELVTLLLSF